MNPASGPKVKTEIDKCKYVFEGNVFCHNCGKRGMWRSEDLDKRDDRQKYACVSCNHIYYITLHFVVDHPRNKLIAEGLRDAEERAKKNGTIETDEVKIDNPISALEL